jgi:hypothetical protein
MTGAVLMQRRHVAIVAVIGFALAHTGIHWPSDYLLGKMILNNSQQTILQEGRPQ